MQAAGIVLIKDSLYDVVNAIEISKKTFRRIKLNFLWAFLYNVLLIPIAMGCFWHYGVHLNPAFASIAMAMSSISVVLSSLILKMFKTKISLLKYIKYGEGFD